MKWKSDTIQQFVRYKIQHPEESYQCLRNYHMEKRQNQHIEKMSKHLQQLRATRDYFLHELHKLKQIAQNQVTRNSHDIEKIDKKYSAIMQRYNQMKTKRSTQLKKSKTQIINEYEKQIQGIKLNHYNQMRLIQQQINKLSEEMVEMGRSGRRQQLRLKIAGMKARIQQFQAECGEKMVRLRVLKSSQEQVRQRQVVLQEKQVELRQRRQQLNQSQVRLKQLQDHQFNQMKLFIQLFHTQLIQKLNTTLLQSQHRQFNSSSLLFPLNHHQSQLLQSPVKKLTSVISRYSVDQSNISNKQISEIMIFNPNIDSSYMKKSKSSTKEKGQIEKLEVVGLDSKVELKRVEISAEQKQIERMATNITHFKSFLNQLKHQHPLSSPISSPIPPTANQTPSNASDYLLTHYNYSSQNFYLILDQMIQSQRNKLQQYRDYSQQFITSQNTKLTIQEAALNKKQKELDKEIYHLQNKVQKTEQEIAKKNRVTI